MNAQQAEALYSAERRGVKQITGFFFLQRTGAGDADFLGFCAMGILREARLDQRLGLDGPSTDGCNLCGEGYTHAGARIDRESTLIVHLNDDHRMTFSEIARKLGPDSV